MTRFVLFLTMAIQYNTMPMCALVNSKLCEICKATIDKTSWPYFGVKLRKKLPIVTLRPL